MNRPELIATFRQELLDQIVSFCFTVCHQNLSTLSWEFQSGLLKSVVA